MDVRDLFAEIEPYRTDVLKVSALHSLYYEEVGNPDGVPIVFLHGGPGGGLSPTHRRFFDPAHYRIILYCQRGAGKSTPLGELEENTTWDLVADLEKLRQSLGIERWIVFGGSWGSTLALTYAISHPERVLGLIVRGIFLSRRHEIRWLYQEGASFIYPDAWEEYLAPIPPAERHDLVGAYYRRLTGEDAEERLRYALAWSGWESKTSFLVPDEQNIRERAEPDRALSSARIECHYFQHGSFFSTGNWLLENVGRIRHIPGVIVQGRYDVVCPATSAWDLHKAWPEAAFSIIPNAGHSATEVLTRSRLVQATEDFKRIAAP